MLLIHIFQTRAICRRTVAAEIAGVETMIALRTIFLVLLVKCCCHAHGKLPYRPPRGPYRAESSAGQQLQVNRGLVNECKEKYRIVALDHFSWVSLLLNLETAPYLTTTEYEKTVASLARDGCLRSDKQ
jgi:hypothetical protein